MNKALITTTLFLVFQVNNAVAQKLKPQFQSYNTISTLLGADGISSGMNSVNGFAANKQFIGIGIGVDFYYHNSIQLYAQGRRQIVKHKNNVLQLVGDIGLNAPFKNEKSKKNIGGTGVLKNGLMYNALVNYIIPIKSNALIIGTGYNIKAFTYYTDNFEWSPVLNRIENSPIKNKYSLTRLSLQIGWRF